MISENVECHLVFRITPKADSLIRFDFFFWELKQSQNVTTANSKCQQFDTNPLQTYVDPSKSYNYIAFN